METGKAGVAGSGDEVGQCVRHNQGLALKKRWLVSEASEKAALSGGGSSEYRPKGGEIFVPPHLVELEQLTGGAGIKEQNVEFSKVLARIAMRGTPTDGDIDELTQLILIRRDAGRWNDGAPQQHVVAKSVKDLLERGQASSASEVEEDGHPPAVDPD